MTPLLLSALAFLAVLAVYLAALSQRAQPAPEAFAGDGAPVPGWAAMFAAAGVAVAAGLGLADHLALSARFGLSAAHVALGLVLAAMVSVMLGKRVWLAGRIAGLASPAAALGSYYGSVTLRLAVLAVALLFALPFAAALLVQAAALVTALTGGALPFAGAVWLMAFALFLPAVIGGWRPLVLITAVLSVLLAALVAGVAVLSEAALPGPGFLDGGLVVAEGFLADRIPAVVRDAAGIGRDMPFGGPFTALGIASAALAVTGIALAPGMLWLSAGTAAGRAPGLGPIWLMAGIAGGLMVLAAPMLAARMEAGAVPFVQALGGLAPFAGLAGALMFLVAAQIGAGFLASSGALVIARDLVLADVLPGLSPRGARLAARLAIAAGFLAVAALASFGPMLAAVLATLALPMAVQLLPGFLGLAWVRWISRGAVLTGLIAGTLVVVFTEPPGLLLVGALFGDLPWGRWPLTVHSAGWGLAANFGAVLLVSIFTRRGPERDRRDRLHDEFAARWRADFGGAAVRGAKWSLTLIWAFLALGPGAILGNEFFGRPMFVGGEAALGVPSLWVWQILGWLVGVSLVWWIAARAGLGLTRSEGLRRVALDEAGAVRRPPGWIAAGLARVTGAQAAGR